MCFVGASLFTGRADTREPRLLFCVQHLGAEEQSYDDVNSCMSSRRYIGFCVVAGRCIHPYMFWTSLNPHQIPSNTREYLPTISPKLPKYEQVYDENIRLYRTGVTRRQCAYGKALTDPLSGCDAQHERMLCVYRPTTQERHHVGVHHRADRGFSSVMPGFSSGGGESGSGGGSGGGGVGNTTHVSFCARM